MALAPYAVSDENSKGREVRDEVLLKDRNEFQRDAARIMHSSAFRRLGYKTQVFANHEGDGFRTRLTHSMEVAQVSRSVSRALSLNEDLAEVLAISHDLGHAPFGHCGQDILNDLMKDHGGFEHNFQGFRVVSELERCYPDFDGLNLMFETTEGILKHCSKENAVLAGRSGKRHITGGNSTLEAQLVNWCDAIAYSHADLEDGLHEGLLSVEQVEEGVPVFAQKMKEARKSNPHLQSDDWRLVYTAIRSMMKDSIADIIATSKMEIEKSGVASPDDVRKHPKELISFSAEMLETHRHLKRFMRQNLYHHPSVMKVREEQEVAIREIFSAWTEHPEWMGGYDASDPRPLHRQVCDKVAELTDRGASAEWHRVKELKSGLEVSEKFPKSMSRSRP